MSLSERSRHTPAARLTGIGRALLCAVPCLLAPGAALAGNLTPVAQTRSVEWASETATQEWFCLPPPSGCTLLSGSPVTDGDAVAAPDFAPFSASLASIVDQTSTIDPTLVTASGSHAATGSASIGFSGTTFTTSYLEYDSRSLFSLDFDVVVGTPYSLTASVAATGGGFIGSSLARVRLVGPGSLEIAKIELEDDGQCLDPECLDLGSLSLDEAGVLAPGSYRLEAEVAAATGTFFSYTQLIAAAGTYSGSYDVTLNLAPADLPAMNPYGLFVLAASIALVGLAGLLSPSRRRAAVRSPIR